MGCQSLILSLGFSGNIQIFGGLSVLLSSSIHSSLPFPSIQQSIREKPGQKWVGSGVLSERRHPSQLASIKPISRCTISLPVSKKSLEISLPFIFSVNTEAEAIVTALSNDKNLASITTPSLIRR